MPIHRVIVNGKPALQYGARGAKYPYKPGNKASREAARQRCIKQALAIQRRSGVPADF
jgi:hypothetical protein